MVDTETPIQYERDLRSADHGAKRSKDKKAKWIHGEVGRVYSLELAPDPLELHVVDWYPDEKARPETRKTPVRRRRMKSDLKANQNREKKYGSIATHRNVARFDPRHEIRTAEELRSVDMLPFSANLGTGPAEDFLYSFDSPNSPLPTLPLGVFVKPDVRGTEKLVEKEYEILDANGNAVRGKKARRALRQAASASPEARPQAAGVEEDEFELV